MAGRSARGREGREEGLRVSEARAPRNKEPLPKLTPCVPRHLRARPCSRLRAALSSAHLPAGCEAHAPASASLLAPQLSRAPGRRSGAPRSTLVPAARTARATGARLKTRAAAGWSAAPPAAVSHSLGIPPWRVFPIEGNLVFRRRANNHSPYSSGEALGFGTLEDYLPLFPDTWAVYFSLRPAAGRTVPSVRERGLRAWHQSPGCVWVRDPSHPSTPS